MRRHRVNSSQRAETTRKPAAQNAPAVMRRGKRFTLPTPAQVPLEAPEAEEYSKHLTVPRLILGDDQYATFRTLAATAVDAEDFSAHVMKELGRGNLQRSPGCWAARPPRARWRWTCSPRGGSAGPRPGPVVLPAGLRAGRAPARRCGGVAHGGPGRRREHFRVPDEGWATLMSRQNVVVQMMEQVADQGIKAAGENSTAGRRLANMRDFYAHVMREMPAVIDRWRASKNTSD